MHFQRDSIFVAGIRSFCVSFSALLGVLLAFIVAIIAAMFLSGPDVFPDKSDLTIAPNAEGDRTLLPASAPVVLKINIHGIIGMQDLTTAKITNCLLDSREGMLQHNRVKAVLLHIDSPGGSASDSDGIYRCIMAYKKKYQVPVYAFVDGLCASGGMYIASAADQIFSTEDSVIGSVGVIASTYFNFSKFLATYGIESQTLSKGKDKDMLNPFRPWQPGEDESLQNVLSGMYDLFVDIVCEARPRLSKAKLVQDYGAQVFLATNAQSLGYIDVAGASYNETLAALTKTAQINADAPYQVFEIQPPHNFFSDLASSRFSLLKGEISHKVQLDGGLPQELCGKVLYLYGQ